MSDGSVVSYAKRIDDLASSKRDDDALIIVRRDGERQHFTFGDLREVAARSAVLIASQPVDPSSMVGVSVTDPVVHAAVVLGAWFAGRGVVPLNGALPDHEARSIIVNGNFGLLIGDRVIDEVDTVQVGSEVVAAAISGSSASVAPAVDGPLEGRIADHAVAFCSGGSTGVPKLISSFGSSVVRGETMLGSFGRAVGYGDGDRVIVATPLFHASGFVNTYFNILDGRSVVLLERFSPERYVDAVEDLRPSISMLVPTMMHRLMRSGLVEAPKFHSLKVLMHSGGPCAPWLKQWWIDVLGAERVTEIYMASEQVGVCVIRGDEWLERPGSVGLPFESEIRILDEERQEVAPGTSGEIFMRPKGVERPSYEYVGVGQGEITPAGFGSVGDLGYVDAHGYLFLEDRRVDMIVTGGANVYPAEVEGVLLAHESVRDAVVVGREDDELGRRVHACVVFEPGRAVAWEVLGDHCKDRMSWYKVPRSFEEFEELPRNEAGKIRRAELADAGARRS